MRSRSCWYCRCASLIFIETFATPGPGVLGSFEFIMAKGSNAGIGPSTGYVDAVWGEDAGRLHGVEQDSWHCSRNMRGSRPAVSGTTNHCFRTRNV